MLEILGILIGFVAIILLLSIIATALVQTALSILQVRRRAFKKGIEAATIPRQQGDVETLLRSLPPAPRPLSVDVAREPTASLSSAGEAAAHATPFEALGVGVNRDAKIIATLLKDPIEVALKNKRTTWIDRTEFTGPLKAFGVDPLVIAAVDKRFEQMTRDMEDRFLVWTRFITVTCALVVAVVFQASTPHILERLLEDEEFRVRAETLGSRLAEDPGDVYRGIVVDAGLDARAAFLRKHPDLVNDLGEVTLEARSVDDLIADVELALEGQDDPDTLAGEYRVLVEKSLANADLSSVRRAGIQARDDLAGLDLSPMTTLEFDFFFPVNEATSQEEFAFDRLFGVLVTTILLSLGAPFWYERLKELVGLKDAIRKRNERERANVKVSTGAAS